MTDLRREHGEIDPSVIAHPESAYDRSDLSARGIIIFFIALAVGGVIVHIVVWGLYIYLTPGRITRQPASAAIFTPSSIAQPEKHFPAPQLQPDPVADLNKFRARTQQTLNSYEWVDQNAGVARIPVERAIDILAQQGLATRPAPALPPAAEFGSGASSPAGAGGGYHPMTRN